MIRNRTTSTLWAGLVVSLSFNIYLLIENGRQKELTALHQKMARQKQEELSAFELKFEENLSVAKAAYARAEAQLEEAKKNLDGD